MIKNVAFGAECLGQIGRSVVDVLTEIDPATRFTPPRITGSGERLARDGFRHSYTLPRITDRIFFLAIQLNYFVSVKNGFIANPAQY